MVRNHKASDAQKGNLPYSLAKLAEYRKLYLEEARKDEAYSPDTSGSTHSSAVITTKTPMSGNNDLS